MLLYMTIFGISDIVVFLHFYIFEQVMKIVVKYFKIQAIIVHSANHAIYTNINKHTPFIQMQKYEIEMWDHFNYGHSNSLSE